jgi:hypothetical protein
MKKVIEYKKHIESSGLVNPPWIIVGDIWYDESTKTYVGIVLDESEREYYVPDTVQYLTKENLCDRLREKHDEQPFRMKIDGVRVPADTIEEFIDHWWSKHIGV